MQADKFTTGIVIDYFSHQNKHIYDVIASNKADGTINEALVVVLPFTDDKGTSWQVRVANAERFKYVEGQKGYDVWHQPPDSVKTNEEYVESVLSTLRKQYKHQEQIVIYNAISSE